MPTYKDEKTGLWYCKFVYKIGQEKAYRKRKRALSFSVKQRNMSRIS